VNKIIIIFVCACAGCLVGLFFYKRYKARNLYFADIVELIQTLIVDVRYRQDGLITVLREYQASIKSDFANTIECFLQGNIDSYKLSLLKKAEIQKVIKFFNSLGKIDSGTQLLILNGQLEKFTKCSNNAKGLFAKYGSTFIKLGFLLGMGFGIIIM